MTADPTDIKRTEEQNNYIHINLTILLTSFLESPLVRVHEDIGLWVCHCCFCFLPSFGINNAGLVK